MPHWLEVVVNLAAAWLAGTLIGVERSVNGHSAGFRTHALVALAAASVGIMTLEPMFFPGIASGLRLDPSRLSQGVMAGIGFLGAGVIFKEGFNVQGLTTAASVWACAGSGFLFGVGFYEAGVLVTVAILVTLSLFRLVEVHAPWRVYTSAVFRFDSGVSLSEDDLRRLLAEHRAFIHDISYRLIDGGKVFEYSANLETVHGQALAGLADRLRAMPGLLEFELSRVGK